MRFWVAGGLVPAEQATVAVLDHGFTVGDGVFETLKTVTDPAVGVVPFAMDRHVVRLARSAGGMGIDGLDADEVRDALGWSRKQRSKLTHTAADIPNNRNGRWWELVNCL